MRLQKPLEVVRSITNFRDGESGEPRDNFRTYYKFAELFGILPLRCIKQDDVELIRVWLSSKHDRGL